MRHFVTLLLAVAVPNLAWAQTEATPPPPPPPIVNAPDQPTATPPPQTNQPATPPPPGSNMPPAGYGQGTGYQPYYGMPYGAPGQKPKGPEWGLMITEGAYGLLTAAAETLLPYLLLSLIVQQSGGTGGISSMGALGEIIVIGQSVALPLTVSSTIIGVANGSHYYMSESWPALLAGLGAVGLVTSAYLLALSTNSSERACGILPCYQPTGADDPVLFLLVAACIAVPITEVVVLNLTKSPRTGMFGGLNYSHKSGWTASIPVPMPFVAPTSQGLSAGITLPLLAGRF